MSEQAVHLGGPTVALRAAYVPGLDGNTAASSGLLAGTPGTLMGSAHGLSAAVWASALAAAGEQHQQQNNSSHPQGGQQFVTKTRKPYTISKQRERWTDEEHEKFLQALKLFGRAWRKIEEHIGTKTAVQIRSHAQKFFSKIERSKDAGSNEDDQTISIPPPRPKRKPQRPYPKKENGDHSGSGNGDVSGNNGTNHSNTHGGGAGGGFDLSYGGLNGSGPQSTKVSSQPMSASLPHSCQQATTPEGPEVTEATVAAVAAAASAAAAAAAAAVVAAAGHQVQAHMRVHPPQGFPFFGVPPALLTQATLQGPPMDACAVANGMGLQQSALQQHHATSGYGTATSAQQTVAAMVAAHHQQQQQQHGQAALTGLPALAAAAAAMAHQHQTQSHVRDSTHYTRKVVHDVAEHLQQQHLEATATTDGDGTALSRSRDSRQEGDGDSACSRETDNQAQQQAATGATLSQGQAQQQDEARKENGYYRHHHAKQNGYANGIGAGNANGPNGSWGMPAAPGQDAAPYDGVLTSSQYWQLVELIQATSQRAGANGGLANGGFPAHLAAAAAAVLAKDSCRGTAASDGSGSSGRGLKRSASMMGLLGHSQRNTNGNKADAQRTRDRDRDQGRKDASANPQRNGSPGYSESNMRTGENPGSSSQHDRDLTQAMQDQDQDQDQDPELAGNGQSRGNAGSADGPPQRSALGGCSNGGSGSQADDTNDSNGVMAANAHGSQPSSMCKAGMKRKANRDSGPVREAQGSNPTNCGNGNGSGNNSSGNEKANGSSGNGSSGNDKGTSNEGNGSDGNGSSGNEKGNSNGNKGSCGNGTGSNNGNGTGYSSGNGASRNDHPLHGGHFNHAQSQQHAPALATPQQQQQQQQNGSLQAPAGAANNDASGGGGVPRRNSGAGGSTHHKRSASQQSLQKLSGRQSHDHSQEQVPSQELQLQPSGNNGPDASGGGRQRSNGNGGGLTGAGGSFSARQPSRSTGSDAEGERRPLLGSQDGLQQQQQQQQQDDPMCMPPPPQPHAAQRGVDAATLQAVLAALQAQAQLGASSLGPSFMASQTSAQAASATAYHYQQQALAASSMPYSYSVADHTAAATGFQWLQHAVSAPNGMQLAAAAGAGPAYEAMAAAAAAAQHLAGAAASSYGHHHQAYSSASAAAAMLSLHQAQQAQQQQQGKQFAAMATLAELERALAASGMTFGMVGSSSSAGADLALALSQGLRAVDASAAAAGAQGLAEMAAAMAQHDGQRAGGNAKTNSGGSGGKAAQPPREAAGQRSAPCRPAGESVSPSNTRRKLQ